MPKHIAIIMDGNGRWAQARGYPRFYGHIRGVARVKEVVRTSRELGVKALTLYAFSTENWKRPEDELKVLWALLRKYIRKEVKELKRNGIRLHVIGEIERLPEAAQRELKGALGELSDCSEMHLTFALSYGGRTEILDAARKMVSDCSEGRLNISDISEKVFSDRLWTAPLGEYAEVDLMIRTSGEQRLSNFLLWQCSYAEFDFPAVLWPDFTSEEFKKSLQRFGERNRRFGGV